jgi:hypothetical protein
MAMMNRLLPGLLLGLGTLLASPVRADEPPSQLPDQKPPSTPQTPPTVPAGCPAPCAPTVSKTICGLNAYLYDVEKETTVPDLKVRDVVTRGKTTEMEITYKEETRTVIATELKPRECEQPVTYTINQPETTVDPCTGCPCTVYKQVPVTKMVKTTVYDCVPVEKKVTIRVPVLKPVERDIAVTTLAVDVTQVPAVCKTLRMVTLPWEMTVQVPACPLPPIPPPPCCHHP